MPVIVVILLLAAAGFGISRQRRGFAYRKLDDEMDALRRAIDEEKDL